MTTKILVKNDSIDILNSDCDNNDFSFFAK